MFLRTKNKPKEIMYVVIQWSLLHTKTDIESFNQIVLKVISSTIFKALLHGLIYLRILSNNEENKYLKNILVMLHDKTYKRYS